MRFKMLGMVLGTLLVTIPMQAYGDDAKIAEEISSLLLQAKSEGDLVGFHLTTKVENGTVHLAGRVSDEPQRDMVLDLARRVNGVKLVVNDLSVENASDRNSTLAPIRDKQVSPAAAQGSVEFAGERLAHAPERTYRPSPSTTRNRPLPTPVPVQRSGSARRVQFSENLGPVSEFGGCAGNGCFDGGYSSGGCSSGGYCEGDFGGGGSYTLSQPAAPGMGGGGYGGGGAYGGVSYENPQMPNYAWPAYAAHPNYAGVTYPKQYSPMAWPYIGPFHPYPQVPLGWRKVCLEWDDGWWQLDFKSK